MANYKVKDILKNDVLMGLMGKACHCDTHNPLQHFNINEGDYEAEVVLQINNIEVPGAAGFLQAYFRQFEKLIAERVRNAVFNEMTSVKSLLADLSDKLVNVSGFVEAELTKLGYLKKKENLEDEIIE